MSHTQFLLDQDQRTFLLGSTSGRLSWATFISSLTDVRYFRCISLFMMWATLLELIRSRPVRSWMPTIVRPMGQGALPIAVRR
jgi:hypothetical protein